MRGIVIYYRQLVETRTILLVETCVSIVYQSQDMETVSDDLKLPPGWIMQKSKTYPDRVYYFNTLTGVSSWAFPGAACSDSDEKAVSTGKNKSKPISSKKLRTPEKHETKVLDLRTRQNSHEKQQQKDILLAADSKSHTSTVVGRLKMAKKSSKLVLENCTREQNKTQMWSTGCPKLTNTDKVRTCERVAKAGISHTLAGDEGSLEQNKLGHLAVPVATDFRKTVDSSLCSKMIFSDTSFKTLNPDCKLKNDNLNSNKKRKKRKKKGIHISCNETDDKQVASKLTKSACNKQSLEGICSTNFKKQNSSLCENSLHKVCDSSKHLKKERRKQSKKSVCPKSKIQQCSADSQKKGEPGCDSALLGERCKQIKIQQWIHDCGLTAICQDSL